MKKLILAASLLLAFTFGAAAQNRSIDFEETKVWKEIVDKAKKENKLIFVDCYTNWCGPCKMLAANVFTQDNVADFFNENFVNAKFEMEQDADGVANMGKWAVSAFPTLIFVDPATETVVHRLVGAGEPDWLIEGGSTAMDPGKNLNSLVERYNEGDRTDEFVILYIKALKDAYMKGEQARVATDYVSGMTLDRMATDEGWQLISENITDPLSKPGRMVIDNRGRFYDIAGQEAVNGYIANSLLGAVNPFISGRVAFDRARYDEIVSYYRTLDIPEAGTALVFLSTAEKADNKDWTGVLADIKKMNADNTSIGPRYSSVYEQAFIPMLGRSNDREIIGDGIVILDKKIASITGEDTGSLYAKAGYLSMKAGLYDALGDDTASEAAKAQSREFSRLGNEAAKGSAMMRLQ